MVILYSSTDLWSELSASERAGSSRSDFSSDLFTKQDIADMFGTSKYLVDDVTYGGIHYFKVVTTTEKETLGLKMSVTMTQLFRIENGWGYTFQFSGDESSSYYTDFLSLIKNVKYNEVVSSSSVVSAVVLLALFAVVVIAVFLMIIRRKALKTVIATPLTPIITSKSVINKNATQYCHMCGSELPVSSAFCFKCGTQIVKE